MQQVSREDGIRQQEKLQLNSIEGEEFRMKLPYSLNNWIQPTAIFMLGIDPEKKKTG